MKDNEANWFGLILIILVALIAIFGTGISIGRSETQKDAILHGAAHYVADAKGEPKFTWNNEKP